MASLRRSKVLSPDGQTAKFLYTIIKQLDLKTIDWNEVASGLEITNGHAARMRYSRFKAQIEGLPTQTKPRAPRPKKDPSAAAKGKVKNKPGYEPGKVDDLMVDEDDGDGDVKMEQDVEHGIKQEGVPRIKQEYLIADIPIHPDAPFENVKIKEEPGIRTENSPTQEEAASNIKVKQEPQAELATYPLSPTSGIAAMNLNPNSMPPPRRPTVSPLGFMPNPPNSFPYHQHQPLPRMPPPQATVSLAELQLPPIPPPPPPGGQMPLPTFSYPLPQMEFDFDFNAPFVMPQQQQQCQMWQPPFGMFRQVGDGGGGGSVVKRERMD
jgi:hypothetical protein